MSTAVPQKAATGGAPTGGTAGYSVARAQGKCQVCGHDIVPGEKLMAALRETPIALERVDVCSACWKTFDHTQMLGYWQTMMPQPSAKKPLFIDDDVLCELFERLGDATEPAKLNFRFVLGLILMRKRRLVYDSTRVQDGSELWTMHFKGREETLDLLNPKLDEQQVTEVSTQLGEILSADL